MNTSALILAAALLGQSPPATLPDRIDEPVAGGVQVDAAEIDPGGHSPASELSVALADLTLNVPATEHIGTRYVSFYNLQPEAWESATAVLSFVLNSLSYSDRIALPSIVPGTGGRVIRVNLLLYGPRAADFAALSQTWEAMVSDLEPYWHLNAEVLDPATANKKKTEVFTDGGWLKTTGLAEAAKLRELTQSGGAIVRGDWFLARATQPPYYYGFTSIPEKEADFFKLIGVDLAVVKALRADEGANIIRSGITRHNRRVVRRQGANFNGGAWQTFDVSESTAEKDPFRNPFNFDYEAGEHIAAKRNGLHLFALYDSKGNRQNAVPDIIAKDNSDPHGDGIVVAMLSCVRCHVEDGLRPFDNDQAALAALGVELYSDSPEAADRLAGFYLSNIGKRLKRDQEDYAEAVAVATGGLSSLEVADGLATIVREYQYELVTPDRAARELGLTGGAEELSAVLVVSRDPVILGLVAGLEMQREQWEASWPEAALIVAGQGK